MASQQMLDFSIGGIDDLNTAFRLMPENIVNKIVRKAVKSAAEIFELSMKRHLAKSRDSGDLQGSITTIVKTYPSQHVVFSATGPRSSGGKTYFPQAHLLEFGHRMVVDGTVERRRTAQTGKGRVHTTGAARSGSRGGGRVVGFVPPQPFARPAEDSNKAAVSRILEIALFTETEREMNRIMKAG